MKMTKYLAISTLIASLAVAGCSTKNNHPAATETNSTSNAQSASAAGPTTIADNRGNIEVPANAQKIVITDNRLFAPAAQWGVKLAAAPVPLLPADSEYRKDKNIVDLGAHSEPNLEALVAVQPDLIINGQRFQKQYDAIKKLVPNAALVDIDVREGKPLDEELRRQIELAGKIFGKETEAQQTVKDFDASIERVKKAYDGKSTVMAVIASKGTLNYAAPTTGRTLGPVFDILGLKPALEAKGSSDHQGDDISVETMAQANPDIILVMDRDVALAARSGEDVKPAKAIIEDSPALANVTAVKNGRVIYMPADTYLNESILTYTKFFNDLAEKLEQK